MDGGGREEDMNVGSQVLMKRPPMLLGYWMLGYLKSMTLTSLSGRLNSLRLSSSCRGPTAPTTSLHQQNGHLRRWRAASFLAQIRRNHRQMEALRIRALKPSSHEKDVQPEVMNGASSSRAHDPLLPMEHGSPVHNESSGVEGANGESSSDETSSLDWSIFSSEVHHLRPSPATPTSNPTFMWEQKREKRETDLSEVEMMKETFARLLLGEDMCGGGKGVCTALAISNAITKLAASVFGELWRLEPLSFNQHTIWRREMEWLLSVCDHILEFVPSSQSFPDGSNLEVMISKPRSDLHINLPALRKIDTMLLESLESFKDSEFWYVDQHLSVSDRNQQTTQQFDRKMHSRKWWVPTPKLPTRGLSDEARIKLHYQNECINQILKAAISINVQTLSEMEVPHLYRESVPKNVRSCLGEVLYRGLNVERFSPDGLLSQLDLSTICNTLDVANRLESAMLICHRKTDKKQLCPTRDSKSAAKSSWGKVKDLVVDANKAHSLAEKAESLLLSVRQKFPGLPQTILHIDKIQYNRDVGQAILESYSRALKNLAFTIACRIEEIVSMDNSTAYQLLPARLSTDGASSNLPKGLSSVGLHPVATPSYATPFASPDYSLGSSNSMRLPNSPLNVEKVSPLGHEHMRGFVNHGWVVQSNKNDGTASSLGASNDSLPERYCYANDVEIWDACNNLSSSSCD